MNGGAHGPLASKHKVRIFLDGTIPSIGAIRSYYSGKLHRALSRARSPPSGFEERTKPYGSLLIERLTADRTSPMFVTALARMTERIRAERPDADLLLPIPACAMGHEGTL